MIDEYSLDGTGWAQVLPANLAMAAALCRAFSQGAVYMTRSVYRPDAEPAFTPGCGRSAIVNRVVGWERWR